MLIINTGGTFNKKYNKNNGLLEVLSDNSILNKIFSQVSSGNSFFSKYELKSIINKDSLDFKDSDRQLILDTILNSSFDKILIIHGTDTMYETASFLSQEKLLSNKKIMITGSMKPFEIDIIEATFNLAMGIGYLEKMDNNICISMNGYVGSFKNVKKNKINGYFEFNLLD